MNELDCYVVDVGIEFDVSDEVDDKIELVVLMNNVDFVDTSVKVGVMFSDVDMNEFDCSDVEVCIKFDVSDEVDDEMELVVLIQNVDCVDLSVEVGEKIQLFT